jgi:hypothetical protein
MIDGASKDKKRYDKNFSIKVSMTKIDDFNMMKAIKIRDGKK